MHFRFHPRCTAALVSLLLAGALALVGCGSSGSSSDSKVLTIATHDSWGMSKKVMAEFTAKTGITVRIAKNGDVGQLTNKLVLTKGDPVADGVYGIDNTFATRAVDEGVLTAYRPTVQPTALTAFDLTGDAKPYLTPIDYGDVCVNVDDTWFAAHHLAEPKTLDDLVEPQYKDLMVTPGATTSSPGLAFLLATISRYGDSGWKAYWKKLLANGVKIDAGWSDAYEVDFTAGGGKGDRPIVLSYSSSPPFTVPEGGTTPTTSALLGTCFRQVEYAGVLKGAKNPGAMKKFIDFMTEKDFQAALPDNMYVYPADTTVALPKGWDTFAPVAPKPFVVTPADITAHRTTWLRDWRDLTTR
ncbi:MAG: thiamine ABC transporter substrate binding subunit [Marmoricola sp.]